MSHFITEYKTEIQDWIERAVNEFNNPDPSKKVKAKLEIKRGKKRDKLKTHYGL